VANFILPILENHTDAFEVFLFSNGMMADIFTNKKRKIFMIHDLNDYDAAKLINDQKIDILIDLNGHTVLNRLGVFSYNPAPIQITYLGYPNTTGLKSINYRLTDKISNPEHSTEKYSEKLLYLPKCFLLYKNISNQAKSNMILGERQLILGSINTESKNSIEVLRVWGKILKECPNTKLLIKLVSFDNKQERLRHYMKYLDTSEDRILLMNKLSDKEYDMLFSKIDIVLDK
jgi:predicted O-linked N-acetylglucosamine transferase (SPINDLY family)